MEKKNNQNNMIFPSNFKRKEAEKKKAEEKYWNSLNGPVVIKKIKESFK